MMSPSRTGSKHLAVVGLLAWWLGAWPAMVVGAELGRLEQHVPLLRSALERDLCREARWVGGSPPCDLIRVGVPLVAEAVEDPARVGVFYARVRYAAICGPCLGTCRPGELEDRYYYLVVWRGHALVAAHLLEGLSDDRDKLYRKSYSLLQGREKVSFTVRVPWRCTREEPPIDPPSPEKEWMVERVVLSVRNWCVRINELSARRGEKRYYPNKVRVVIEDFNVDQDSTRVLVKDPFEILEVNLHCWWLCQYDEDPQREEERYQTDEHGYFVTPRATYGTGYTPSENAEAKAYEIKQIRARGIEREILLGEEEQHKRKRRTAGTGSAKVERRGNGPRGSEATPQHAKPDDAALAERGANGR
ncbi:hypothetical protein HRbin30_00062 [bacterium HR30]|nr:hypothetical protein HRbin30_00062 [bacterium HR30]